MSFDDLERPLEDILSSFFHTLYFWTAAFVSHLMISYDIFLFTFLFLVRCFLLYTPGILRDALQF
jgi:hypothetical protein